MAANEWEIVNFSLPATTGTFDITKAGFGTPELVLFFMTGSLNGVSGRDVDTQVGMMHFGATDGTNHFSNCGRYQDNVGTSVTSRSSTVLRPIRLQSNSGASDLIFCDFDSFITDGIRLNCIQASGWEPSGFAILIRGNLENIHIGNHDLGATTSAQSINVGFQPHLMFGFNIGAPNVETRSGDCNMSMGICAERYDDALVQRCWSMHDDTNKATTAVVDIYRTGRFSEQVTDASGSIWAATVSAFTATGFNFSTSASSGNDELFLVALKFVNRPDMELPLVNIPTSGDVDVTLNIEPDFHMLMGFDSRVAGQVETQCSWSMAAFETGQSTTSISCTMGSTRDAVGTSDTLSRFETTSFKLYDPQATGVGYYFVSSGRVDNVDGYTFTATTNPAIARLGFGFSLDRQDLTPGTDGFKFGGVDVDDIKIGTGQVDAAYLGSTQIF